MSTSTLLDRDALAAFVERYLAAWNSRSAAPFGELVTDDVVWDDPALPQPARGRAEFEGFLATSWRAFPDLAFDRGADFLAVEGDRAAFSWHMAGTNSGPLDPPGFAPTGRSIDVHGMDLVRMVDGRIADYRAFYDMQGLVRQLGLVPAPGSRGERALISMQRLGAKVRNR
jgi:steroid delta-isomerase-like uncharacterized protein